MNNKELIELQKRVYEANMLLYNYKLAIHTWGNVSGISLDRKYMAIKPSGVSYQKMKYSDMVIIEIASGKKINSELNPSSDTPTHLLLYQNFPKVKAIVHTHSPNAIAWAQNGKDIPCYGTTHADNFYGSIPCARSLSKTEINSEYEHNTGLVILEKFATKFNYISSPGCLVKNHGPFTWSTKSEIDAVNIALTLEEIAKMARYTIAIDSNVKEVDKNLMDYHYNRKHGKNAYYGQIKK